MSDELKRLIDLLSTPAFSNSVRVGILLSLLYLDRITFTDLLKTLDLPKSTLFTHLQVLQDEGLILMKKGLTLDGPRTFIVLTDKGKELINQYLTLVKRLNEH